MKTGEYFLLRIEKYKENVKIIERFCEAENAVKPCCCL